VTDPEVGTHPHDILFLARLQAHQEMAGVSVVGIGHHTAVRHAPSPGLIEQRQRHLGLGLKRHLRWQSGSASALGILGPGLRQGPPHGHRPRRLGIGVATGHRDLAMAHLTQSSRVLARDPHRRLTLLGKTGVIQHQRAVAQGGLGDHLLHPLAVEVLCIPWHGGEELLQALFTGAGNRLGDSIAVLVGQLGKQPRRVPLQGICAFWPPEAHLEAPQKLFQFRQLVRTGMHIHGHPPLTAEDTT
jgi:hypothetical protein